MDKTRFTIGRERTCDIPIADDSVSRLHAELSVLEGGKYFLTDCHSSNGTRLLRAGQSRAISQETVYPTDRIQFGNVVLAVADLIEAIEARQPGPLAAAAERPFRPDAGSRLVRCECGAIKPVGRPCPACAGE